MRTLTTLSAIGACRLWHSRHAPFLKSRLYLILSLIQFTNNGKTIQNMRRLFVKYHGKGKRDELHRGRTGQLDPRSPCIPRAPCRAYFLVNSVRIASLCSLSAFFNASIICIVNSSSLRSPVWVGAFSFGSGAGSLVVPIR